jgi:hypothetical protein
MLTATAWGTEGPERQEVAEPAKRKVEAETRCISGHTQRPATSGYAPPPATSRYIPTHATSGCWSGGKPEARREARCRPARCPVFDSWSIPPRRSRAAHSVPPKHSARWRSPSQRPRRPAETWCGAFSFARRRSLPFDMLRAAMSRARRLVSCRVRHTSPFTCQGEYTDITSIGRCYGQDQIFQRGRPYVFNAGISWNRLASRYPWYLLASRTHCRRPFHLVLQVVIPMLDSSSVQNGSMSMRLQAHRFAGTSCRGGTSAMSRASAIRSG